MPEIINPHDPNPIPMTPVPLKQGTQIVLNITLEHLGVNVKVKIAYKGHLWKEDVGDIHIGSIVQNITPPKKGNIIIL